MSLGRPVVVYGDVMLDVDVTGACERLSPEAPVPVISDPVRRTRPGGAALAALLAARRGVHVILVAPFADDEAAGEIRRHLDGFVEVAPLSWTGATPVKTRIRIGDHPVARLDGPEPAGHIGPLPPPVRALFGKAAAVLVSDYGRGASSCFEARNLLGSCAACVPIVWDPHPRGAAPVPGVRVVTPNAAESARLWQTYLKTQPPQDEGEQACGLATAWHAQSVLVTLGGRGGMLGTGAGAPQYLPARQVTASDTCGAGDALAAAVTAALAEGALPSEAAMIGVRAATDFVEAGGAAAVAAGQGQAVADGPPTDLLERLAAVRRDGGSIVATGGCFDLLHAGHIATLAAARRLGDVLVVCLNSDDSVRRLKGPDRPLQSETDRREVLRALRFVDDVVVFDEDTPEQVLRRLRPDIWVKGGDYSGADLPERAVLREWGGRVVTVPYLDGRSTSGLVARVLSA
jgi:rfaE bifunctional protein nucleotidyltransferase chain/domain/rfaE bifunctional protein kinase chain/domain